MAKVKTPPANSQTSASAKSKPEPTDDELAIKSVSSITGCGRKEAERRLQRMGEETIKRLALQEKNGRRDQAAADLKAIDSKKPAKTKA